MKFTTAYYLMLLYIFVMFRPLMPLISDGLSHTFAEAIHIATVHAKYGENHLEKALEASGNENDNSKSQNTVKAEDQAPVHIPETACTYAFQLNRVDKKFPSLPVYKIPAIIIGNPAPPPKFC